MRVKEACPHCDTTGFAFRHTLGETANFIICDAHPLMEGHLLIIPREHLSCAGAFPPKLFQEFLTLFHRCWNFLKKEYGNVSAFEHGQIGQTVFHAHMHLLPCAPNPRAIVPEGQHHLTVISGAEELPRIFKNDGRYLFLAINDQSWIVDPSLGAPRFFRDRFASALGVPERGNWQEMDDNPALMQTAEQEIARCKERWLRAHP